MLYKMKLNEGTFEKIKNGTKKTIELRTFDEKGQQIKVGDKIEFSKLPNLQEILEVEVLDIYRDKTFKEYGVAEIKLIKNNFRYTYNKLVRDKIPENIDSEQGRKCKYKVLNDTEYLQELNKKILEEANEFIEENSIEELGDLMEVIYAIMKLKGYSTEEVNKSMNEKSKKKGSFNNRIFLEYVNEEKRNLEEEKELNKGFRKK